MKTRRLAAVVGALGIAWVAFTPLVAYAGGTELEAVDGGSVSEPSESWVDADGYIRLPKPELEALVAGQTPKQIEALVESGEPLNLLIDAETGAYLGAVVAEQAPIRPAETSAITLGCSPAGHATSNRYTSAGGAATCFNGSGVLYINLPSTYFLSAGDLATVWYPGSGSGIFVSAYSSGTLSSTLDVVKVIR